MKSVWRTFLEKPSREVDSYVVVAVRPPGEDTSIMLKIADCERNVKLWFPWGSAESEKVSRLKLSRLREALDRVEAGLDYLREAERRRQEMEPQ